MKLKLETSRMNREKSLETLEPFSSKTESPIVIFVKSN